MKFVTAEIAGDAFVGLFDEKRSRILQLGKACEKMTGRNDLPDTMKDCIALGDPFIQKAARLFDWASHENKEMFTSLENVKMLAPIPQPSKNIFCVGKNYKDHVAEMGGKDIPEHIIVFTKAPTTVIGHKELIQNHKEVTSQLDYEGELAVVIGKKGKAIKKEEALDYVFGYTIINDVTARDLQNKHNQFFIGKSLDTTCPMGPCITHSSAIEDPNNLEIMTVVNGEIRQYSNTKNFIFPIEEIIAVVSQGMTLEQGDIIATGTPSGVGMGFNPPRFLQPGDKIDITVEGVGTLSNIIKM